MAKVHCWCGFVVDSVLNDFYSGAYSGTYKLTPSCVLCEQMLFLGQKDPFLLLVDGRGDLDLKK
jgi:hypothetical protein